jgi:hypothetical protein
MLDCADAVEVIPPNKEVAAKTRAEAVSVSAFMVILLNEFVENRGYDEMSIRFVERVICSNAPRMGSDESIPENAIPKMQPLLIKINRGIYGIGNSQFYRQKERKECAVLSLG